VNRGRVGADPRRHSILYVGHTRRLLIRLARVTTALAFVVAVGASGGCSDRVYYANSGAAGSGGSTGGCATCDAGSGTAGGGVGGSAAGTGGSIAGVGGSVGGAGDGAGSAGAGVGGSIGGAGPGSGGQAGVTMQPWPTSDPIVTVDGMNEFGSNLSDLVYEPRAGGDVLWGVQNNPSTLYCLTWNGTTWAGITDDDWANGKTIRYPGGTGHPDSEGMTRTEWTSNEVYVAAERNNDDNNVSRLSVLRYDTSLSGTTELVATHEWNLTSDLPAAGANLGLEAIAWIPDSFLVGNGFFDEAANATYNPALYPNHGGGLFFVGLENNGMIYGFALDHSGGTFKRVATISSAHSSIMSLTFDRDVGNLWAYCDDTCANQATVLRISAGRFVVQYLYNHPSALQNWNFEGITFAPESECAQGKKSFFWSDDSADGGHALYRGTIPCGLLP